MARFKSRPIEIEATQWHRDGDHPAVKAVPGSVMAHGAWSYEVWSINGWVKVNPGDWIIKEPNGDGFYPCNQLTFEERYEPVEQAQAKGDDYSKTDESAKPSDGITKTLPVIGGEVATDAPKLAAHEQQGKPSMVQQPGIGSIVRFYSARLDDDMGGKLCPAIIADVLEGDPNQVVQLIVFHPYCGALPFHDVPMREKSAGGPVWWDWPPHVPAKSAG